MVTVQRIPVYWRPESFGRAIFAATTTPLDCGWRLKRYFATAARINTPDGQTLNLVRPPLRSEERNINKTNTAEKYFVLCTVHADTSNIAEALKPQQGKSGTYYRLDFEMVLSFGLTELKAQIAWFENVSAHPLLSGTRHR
jgi:hypothetical protein